MSNSVEDLANAWHAPFCAVDAGGGCILDSDLKEAWIAGYSAALERAHQEIAELRAENELLRNTASTQTLGYRGTKSGQAQGERA